MHGGSAYNSRSLDLHIARYPTVPSLEQYQNVDVQVGGRLFQQVPQKVRSDLWSNLTRKTYTGQDCIMRYPALQAQVVNQKTCSEIEKDVPRTFPDVPGFNDPVGQRRLMRMLRSYALLDPEVGYCQGMNFVAGLVLKYLSNEAEAFGAFCVLMRDKNYRELFLPHMLVLQAKMADLERRTPANVSEKLKKNAIGAALYAPQWLLSCFGNEFPTTFGARIIDCLLGGPVLASDALLRVALEVLSRIQFPEADDFEGVLRAIREGPRRWSHDQLAAILTRALLT